MAAEEAERAAFLMHVEERWNAAEMPIVQTMTGTGGSSGLLVIDEPKCVELAQELRDEASRLSSMLHADNHFVGEFAEVKARLGEAANVLELWLAAQGECMSVSLVLKCATVRRSVLSTPGV